MMLLGGLSFVASRCAILSLTGVLSLLVSAPVVPDVRPLTIAF